MKDCKTKNAASRRRRAEEIFSGIFEAVLGLPVYLVLAAVALPAAAAGALRRLVSRRAAAL